MVSKDIAYEAYEHFSSRQKEYKPSTKSAWAKKLGSLLGPNLTSTRPTESGERRVRSFQFAPLATCREHFATKIKADFEWDPLEPAESINTGVDLPGSMKQTPGMPSLPSLAATPVADPADPSRMGLSQALRKAVAASKLAYEFAPNSYSFSAMGACIGAEHALDMPQEAREDTRLRGANTKLRKLC
jgi:hypothetical protein